jgi:hypothetical protein
MNCQQPVGEKDAKFFRGTFVCGTCYTIAERLRTRARKELTDLLVMLDEAIRLAIIERRLQFREGTDVELSKKEVLEAIVKLQEMKDAHAARSMAHGSGSVPVPGSEPQSSGGGDQ